MSIWRWIDDYLEEAQQSGDPRMWELYEVFIESQQMMETDPQQALLLNSQARALAEQLELPWWILTVDHWRLQILLNRVEDYKAALDLAVKTAVRGQRGECAGCPQRVCVQEDLISAYVGIDPAGYSYAIEKALDYMRREVSPEAECRLCIQDCATIYHYECGRHDAARESARVSLEMIDAEPNQSTKQHHLMETNCTLARIAFAQKDWEQLRASAAVGEEIARSKQKSRRLATFLVWQGLLAQLDGDPETAQRLVRQGTVLGSRGRALPETGYFDALTAYHEAAYDLARALKVRTRQLELIGGKGQLLNETRVRTDICRLKAGMGLPFEEDRAAAEAVARQLRDPAPHLTRLQQVTAG